MLTHAFISGTQKIDLLLPVDKTDVRYLVYKFRWLINHSFTDSISPKLLGLLKLLKDFNRLAHLDFSIFPTVGRVSHFTNPRMASARIIPTIGTLLRKFLRYLIKFYIEARIEFLEQCTQIRGHYSATNQDDIKLFHHFVEFCSNN